LAVDPHRRGAVFAGTQGNGIVRSNDAGKTWEAAGLDGQVVKSIAVSPAQPGLVFAGTNPARVFVSRDNAQTWNELNSFQRVRKWWWFSPAESPWTAYVQALAPSPTDPQVLMVGIELGAVVRTEDGGASWSGHRPGSLRDCHGMTFHHSDGHWVYEAGGTGGGVSLSRDGGVTWNKRKDGLDRNYGWACAADPEKPEIWYASLSPGPGKAHGSGGAEAVIFRAVGGAPWVPLRGGLPDPLDYMPYALITDPEAPGHVYAGLSNGEVWHSSNHGDEWSRLPFKFRGIHRSMVRL
jgi:photosystem II stability/assembly factor-like uncharacterized protein